MRGQRFRPEFALCKRLVGERPFFAIACFMKKTPKGFFLPLGQLRKSSCPLWSF